jgi:archaetidylinositol phosphate synthase
MTTANELPIKLAVSTPISVSPDERAGNASTRDSQAQAALAGKLEFKTAPRLQTSLTAAVERRALHYLAARLPARVNSDHLTLLGLAAMIAAGACYWAARWWPPAMLIVNFWLVVNWFGDSLDGTLARLRNRQRPRYGFYVDHIVDALGILALMSGLALSGYMSWLVAMAFLVAYFLLSIDIYLATYTIGAFRMAYCKLGPTELRVLLGIGNTAAFLHPRAQLFGDHLLFDVSTSIAIAALAAIAIASIARNTATLYRMEMMNDE